MTKFRRTKGIIDDNGNPIVDADVIMTAVILGFTAWRLGDPADFSSPLKPLETGPVRFDADFNTILKADLDNFKDATGRIERAVATYLKIKSPTMVAKVSAGLAGEWSAGASIMGVYSAAGQTAPDNIAQLQNLSVNGAALWEAIKNNSVKQYTGRGAYSGFVDDSNGKVLAGPLSTARFWASNADKSPERWVPSLDVTKSPWLKRTPNKKSFEDPVPFSWGLIGGDQALPPASPSAQEITDNMAQNGMVFNGMEDPNGEVAMYTHGMIQSIYLAYRYGPNCRAYEIAVGNVTTKMASCMPCAFFMSANGYFPNSIHLGRGESWAPLFSPYHEPAATNGDQQTTNILPTVVDDLNNSWYERCLLWLQKGLDILTPSQLANEDYTTARNMLVRYVHNNINDKTLGGRLVLDAVTMHDSEQNRLLRTLKPL